MKILHIASGDFFSTYGGGQVYVKNIVDTMISIGEDISVISSVESNNLICKDYNGACLYEIPSETDYNTLKKLIQDISPDVIHAHSNKAVVCRIGKELGIPVVVTAHHGGILCPAGTRIKYDDTICKTRCNHKSCLPCVLREIPTGLKIWYPIVRHISESKYIRIGNYLKNKYFIPFITPIGTAALHIKEIIDYWKEVAAKCTAMIAPSHELGEAMIVNGLDKNKLVILPHGIPLPERNFEYPDVENGKIKFYYVGRICHSKGIHILLNAFSLVSNSDIELHIIGTSGNKREERYMKRLQNDYRKGHRIIWHGKIASEKIFEFTKNYHVLISPSFLESFGLNIAEALALGKPVISTLSGGGEMQIKVGVNGWLVPTNNPLKLSETIQYTATHPEVLPVMSKQCNAIPIVEHCQNLIDIYRSIL